MIDLSPRTGDLEPIETAPLDELRTLQLRRLRWTLRHAYDNVPLYRRTFDAAGVHPDDCRTLEDLGRFPFTTKADLRDTYPFGMSPCRASASRASTPPAARPASRPSWATPSATSTPGPT